MEESNQVPGASTASDQGYSLPEVLLGSKILTESQLGKAQELAAQWGKPIEHVLLAQGLLNRRTMLEVLSILSGIPVFDGELPVIKAEWQKLVPYELVKKHRMIPLGLFHNGGDLSLRLGVAEVLDKHVRADLEEQLGIGFELVLLAEEDLDALLATSYRAEAAPVMDADQPAQAGIASPRLEFSAVESKSQVQLREVRPHVKRQIKEGFERLGSLLQACPHQQEPEYLRLAAEYLRMEDFLRSRRILDELGVQQGSPTAE